MPIQWTTYTDTQDNFKGREGYEEKKAKKLVFTFLYDYFDEKLKNSK